MYKRLFSLCIIFVSLCVSFVKAQEVSVKNIWSGVVNIGQMRMPIEFRILCIDSNEDIAEFRSPFQSETWVDVSDFVYTDTVLNFRFKNIEYRGAFDGDSIIFGRFKQGGLDVKLDLRPGYYEFNRPQTPIAPFPYLTKDVEFVNKETGLLIAGTLTTPEFTQGIKTKKFPAIVLITGSGAQDRNEAVFGHKPFMVVADYLSRRGVVVLRCDDRGVGGSQGDFAKIDSDGTKSDLLASFDFLCSQAVVDKNKVGVLGHSEGGTVAFMAASERKDISFVVSMAGMAVRGDSLLIKQNEAMLKHSPGIAPLFALPYSQLLRKVYLLRQQHDLSVLKQNTDSLRRVLVQTFEGMPISLIDNAMSVLVLDSPFFSRFITLDPAVYLRNIACPVLAINGDKDIQVDSKQNLEVVKSILGDRSTVIEYKDLNHLFQPCKTGNSSEYPTIETTIEEQVLSDIYNWVLLVCDGKIN